jgi:hypothetical protein
MPQIHLEGQSWRLSMGLHRLDPRQWLDVDSLRADELALKHRLLEASPGAFLAVRQEGREGSRELLELVASHIVGQHPGVLARRGSELVELTTGAVVDTAAMEPIEAAGRVAQEDLCVLTRSDDEWRLTAASVCFPSRWRLADKVGRSLRDIHGPVPGFGTDLSRQASTFFDRLAVSRPVWRCNWTIVDTPALSLPSPASRRHGGLQVSDCGTDLWFRVERQTLRRLERTGSVAFTIRTYVMPLGALVDARPEMVEPLRATLRAMSGDFVTYKGWSVLVGPLDEWLSACALRSRADSDVGSPMPESRT